MDNQHRQIKGYRELSQTEIDLMNTIKEVGAQMELLDFAVKDHLNRQSKAADPREDARILAAEPHRWRSIARTHFQEGMMALVRAVAQPTN